MDEVREFCRRVLGDDEVAEQIAGALPPGLGDRIGRLTAAAKACRLRSDEVDPDPRTNLDLSGLARSVARELAQATGRLPERQREALALRELLRLSYEQIARVMGIDATAVPLLLARARLRLRAERRGSAFDLQPSCPDRERTLRGLVRRHDSEPLTAADDGWLVAHLRACPECGRAHAAMLEASACYRAWPSEQRRRTTAPPADAPRVRAAATR